MIVEIGHSLQACFLFRIIQSFFVLRSHVVEVESVAESAIGDSSVPRMALFCGVEEETDDPVDGQGVLYRTQLAFSSHK